MLNKSFNQQNAGAFILLENLKVLKTNSHLLELVGKDDIAMAVDMGYEIHIFDRMEEKGKC